MIRLHTQQPSKTAGAHMPKMLPHQYLASQDEPNASRFNMAEGLYAYLTTSHRGQTCPLYAALCRLQKTYRTNGSAFAEDTVEGSDTFDYVADGTWNVDDVLDVIENNGAWVETFDATIVWDDGHTATVTFALCDDLGEDCDIDESIFYYCGETTEEEARRSLSDPTRSGCDWWIVPDSE